VVWINGADRHNGFWKVSLPEAIRGFEVPSCPFPIASQTRDVGQSGYFKACALLSRGKTIIVKGEYAKQAS
jgi:hypothetical protein